MQTQCAPRSRVGNRPTIRWTVTPDELHPTAESTAVTLHVHDSNGDEMGPWSSPDAALLHTTSLALDGTLISYWDFTFPDALTVGSRRRPYIAYFESTAGIIASGEVEQFVDPAPF